MLWYKNWLETRFRLLFLLAVMGFMIFVQNSKPHPHGSSGGTAETMAFVTMTFINVVVAAAVFGGAGIATQPSFATQRGTHGSTLFTVSLPVSRVRMLCVRAALGWCEVLAAMAVFCGAAWFALPWIRLLITGREMLGYTVALLTCGSMFYCVAVLLGSFLEDQWRAWGTMLVAGAFSYAAKRLHFPAFVDVFGGMSQLVLVHAMPWSAMVFSLCVSAALLVATARIVQLREY